MTDAPVPGAVERRIVSVLFADLVGFTPLSERLDAEDVATIQDAYFAAVRDTITRYGGVLEKFIGDAAMAAFGVPAARDDDAERAVRAGLALLGAVEQLGARLGLEAGELQLRVGVNSGEVVHATEGPDAGRFTGDTVNTAARLQTAARPGSVLIGELTALAVAEAIETVSAGPVELKGKGEPGPRRGGGRASAAALARGGARRDAGADAGPRWGARATAAGCGMGRARAPRRAHPDRGAAGGGEEPRPGGAGRFGGWHGPARAGPPAGDRAVRDRGATDRLRRPGRPARSPRPGGCRTHPRGRRGGGGAAVAGRDLGDERGGRRRPRRRARGASRRLDHRDRRPVTRCGDLAGGGRPLGRRRPARLPRARRACANASWPDRGRHRLPERDAGWCDYARCELLWLLGEWDEALRLGEAIVDLAERNAYDRLAFRTYVVLLPLTAARRDPRVADRYAAWHEASAPHLPSALSPYARPLRAAADVWIASAHGRPIPPPPPETVDAVIPMVNAHFIAAIEDVTRAWIDTGRTDLAEAAADRLAGFAAEDDATPLMRASAALVAVWLGHGDPEEAVRTALEADAPWWIARALRAAGRAAEADELEVGLTAPA